MTDEERRAHKAEQTRKWREEHPGYQEAWRLKNPEMYKAGMLRGGLKRMGLTPDQYNDILEEQGGVCALCKQPPKRTRLSVDHDHDCCPSERACEKCRRGLLCNICNVYIVGHLEKAGVRPERLVEYLKKRI